MPYILHFRRVKFLIISVISALTLLLSVYTVNAGGGGEQGGGGGGQNTQMQAGRYQVDQGNTTASRNVANMFTRDFNANPNSMCSGCRAYTSSNRDGTMNVTISKERGEGGNQTPTSVKPGVTTPTCANKNLTTIDIFFVPTGAQPASSNQRTNSGSPAFSRLLNTANPYQRIIVAGNRLQVGVSYEPIAQIRNSASCGSSGRDGGGRDRAETFDGRKHAFLGINTVYAGGGSSRTSRPNDYPDNVRNQLPFGIDGSFPVRARIDVGNNTIIDWEQYINAIGPLHNGQTMYLRLPAFTTTEIGAHSIEIITDIRHSIDPARGCYASSTPDSAGWGCLRETNERDNDRRETFTTIGSSTSASLRVETQDVTVSAGSELRQLPVTVTNTGIQNITSYVYTARINRTLFASSTRSSTLTPGARENVSANGSYAIPDSPTTIPFTVCGQVGTGTQSCDTARLIVTAPQCSDNIDNDSDRARDRADTGCFTNPTDPSTYNPNDNNESDAAILTPPEVTLEAENTFVRSNSRANITYRVRATYAMSCTLTGPGIASTFTYTSGVLERTLSTDPLINKQLLTISCLPSGVPSGSYQPTTRELMIEIIPQVQEV